MASSWWPSQSWRPVFSHWFLSSPPFSMSLMRACGTVIFPGEGRCFWVLVWGKDWPQGGAGRLCQEWGSENPKLKLRPRNPSEYCPMPENSRQIPAIPDSSQKQHSEAWCLEVVVPLGAADCQPCTRGPVMRCCHTSRSWASSARSPAQRLCLVTLSYVTHQLPGGDCFTSSSRVLMSFFWGV